MEWGSAVELRLYNTADVYYGGGLRLRQDEYDSSFGLYRLPLRNEEPGDRRSKIKDHLPWPPMVSCPTRQPARSASPTSGPSCPWQRAVLRPEWKLRITVL